MNNTSTENSQQKTSRRDFLKVGLFALGSLATLEISGVIMAYLQPQTGEGEFGGIISVGKEENFQPGSLVHILNGQFYLARLPDGGFMALYHRCPHLGCVVQWEQDKDKFNCPCHNSQFTKNGEVINPPAPRPLDLFSIDIKDGQIFVDTGRPMPRDRFDPSQVTYA